MHRYHFAHTGSHSQSYGFSSSHIQMWELDHKEGWKPKNWCFQNVVLEKTLESALDSKEINPVNPKLNQSWISIRRTDAEAWAPILWPPDEKSWLTGKDPDAGKDWGQEEKGMTEDEMVGWHHWLSGREFDQTPGDSEGQGSLAYCSSWDHKESDTTERLNNNKNGRKGRKGPAIPGWGPREESRELLMSWELLVTHPLGNGWRQRVSSDETPTGSVRATGRKCGLGGFSHTWTQNSDPAEGKLDSDHRN